MSLFSFERRGSEFEELRNCTVADALLLPENARRQQAHVMMYMPCLLNRHDELVTYRPAARV